MNTIGHYNDERSNYSFNFHTEDGKHVNLSFRAEPDYDLNTIFDEFRNFLIASGHDIEGQIGELFHEEDEWEDGPMERTQFEPKDRLMQNPTQDKFSMDHLPNNGWPFGGLTSQSIPALTTADIAPLTVTDLSTNQTYSYKDRLMQNPTMAPLTTEQIKSWSLPTQDIKSWSMNAPGTLGGAELNFKDEKNDWSPRSKDYRA